MNAQNAQNVENAELEKEGDLNAITMLEYITHTNIDKFVVYYMIVEQTRCHPKHFNIFFFFFFLYSSSTRSSCSNLATRDLVASHKYQIVVIARI